MDILLQSKTNIGPDCENLILDYKAQLEHRDKYKYVMDVIRRYLRYAQRKPPELCEQGAMYYEIEYFMSGCLSSLENKLNDYPGHGEECNTSLCDYCRDLDIKIMVRHYYFDKNGNLIDNRQDFIDNDELIYLPFQEKTGSFTPYDSYF